MLNRRSLIARGAIGAAAVALTAGPALGLANGAKIKLSVDAELLQHGEHCKVQALETARLGRLFAKAAARQAEAFYAMKPERWRCDAPTYQGGGRVVPVPGVPAAWQVLAVDGASRYFASCLGMDVDVPDDLPKKWIRLKAKSEAEANREATALARSLDDNFFAKLKQAGVQFNRDEHYGNWTAERRFRRFCRVRF
jgi:hypothetical protein